MSHVMCSLPGKGGTDPDERSWESLSANPHDRLRILRQYRSVAMVGLSPNPLRPSHFVAIYLANRGYDIIPVNPGAKEILGRKCFPALSDVDRPIEIVDIFRSTEYVPEIVEESISVGAKAVWMQFGVIHEPAARRALAAGLAVVIDRCMKVEHARFFGGMSPMGLNSNVVSARSWDPSDGKHGL
ncbi:MAG: CoA-binding protein [Bryobacterales bacterium]|nr:CoA-binding protein [Bryobacterales bacterium]